MTEREIMEMPAGCELDALIARHVMGWARLGGLANYTGKPETFWETGERWCIEYPDPETVYRLSPEGGTPFRPSTEIADAWGVVFATRARDWWWEICSHHGKDGGWQGSVWTDHKSGPDETRAICWDAETPQLAICRAALCGAVTLKRLAAVAPA